MASTQVAVLPALMYGLFPHSRSVRNHARLRFTYILDARITDYVETHPWLPVLGAECERLSANCPKGTRAKHPHSRPHLCSNVHNRRVSRARAPTGAFPYNR